MTHRLKAEELPAGCDAESFTFASTAELTPLTGLIGQERALDATAFGIGMPNAGYNLFVLGLPATGKATSMRRLLDATATGPDAVGLVLRPQLRRRVPSVCPRDAGRPWPASP
jgi:hypothetical protein